MLNLRLIQNTYATAIFSIQHDNIYKHYIGHAKNVLSICLIN